jgi:hypothetical protein
LPIGVELFGFPAHFQEVSEPVGHWSHLFLEPVFGRSDLLARQSGEQIPVLVHSRNFAGARFLHGRAPLWAAVS